MSLIKLHHHTV